MNDISLRDYFAATALNALIAKMPAYDIEGKMAPAIPLEDMARNYDAICESAYAYANCMIKMKDR